VNVFCAVSSCKVYGPFFFAEQHPKADTDRLYVPRKQEGRGMMQFEEVSAVEITKLVENVDSKEDPLI
jgi:hypothetical protein